MIERRASEADLPELLEIAEEPDHRQLERALGQGSVLVVATDDVIVGFAIVDESFFGQPFLWLLVVRRDMRRRGVGRRLVRAALDGSPAPKFFTSTNESNVPMQRLLVSEGFTRSGTIENLDPGDPELVFFKDNRRTA